MPPAWLADVVVLLHLLYVALVVLGFLAVPLGAWRGWRWVRNRLLRRMHLAMIALVAGEASLGWVCPLTTLEWELRGGGAPASFMGRVVHALMFYEWPSWFFTAAYLALTALALALYWLVPPAAAGAAGTAGAAVASVPAGKCSA